MKTAGGVQRHRHLDPEREQCSPAHPARTPSAPRWRDPCKAALSRAFWGRVSPLEQQSPTFLAPGTRFMEDNFSTDVGVGGEGDGSGGNVVMGSDGEQETKLRSLARRSPPAVRPGS